MQIFIYISCVCGPDLSVEPAATVGATIEHVSEGSRGVVTIAGSATIATVVCTAAVSVAVESLLRTIVIAVVTTAVAVATIVVVAIVIAVVAVVVAVVVGIVLTVVVAVAVAIIIAVAFTIVVIVVVAIAIVVAQHGSHHILHLGSHGSIAGLKISFPALQAVGNFVNWSGGRRLGRRRWLSTWREFCTLLVKKTLKNKVSNRSHVGLVGWRLMIDIASSRERAEVGLGVAQMLC
jgi:hypothetical protein